MVFLSLKAGKDPPDARYLRQKNKIIIARRKLALYFLDNREVE